MRCPVITVGCDQASDNDQGDTTTNGTSQKQGPASDAVEEDDGREGEHGVNDAVDTGGEERGGVGVKTKLAEN